MPHGRYHYDTSILELLDMLSSEKKQLAYKVQMPYVDVPGEMLCMWFDDLYLPDYEGFQRCFSKSELKLLAQFHGFYDERRGQFPYLAEGLEAFHSCPAWREVMQKAQKTLEAIKRLRDPS